MISALYDDQAAISLGVHTTPSDKSLVYVYANGSSGFKVWKEKEGNRILRANGEDEWAKDLNLNGKGQSTTDFEDANIGSASTIIAGRACPDNVYIDDANKFTTTNCVYFSPASETTALNSSGTSQTYAGSMGLREWISYNGGAPRWYVGNIKICSDKGMRLPTIYETTVAGANTSNVNFPYSDGSPIFAEGNGVSSPSYSSWTWTASSSLGDGLNQAQYWIWAEIPSFIIAYPYNNSGHSSPSSYGVVCLLP